MKRQPSSAEKSIFSKGNEGLTRIVAGGALALAAVALAGCVNTSAEGPSSSPTSSSSSTPTPEVTPTQKPENVFAGTVNYDSFVGFAEMDETQKDVVCAEFFGTNLPNGIVVTEHSTGPEVAQWQAEHLDVLAALNGDTTDPRNQEVAKNIVDCLTSTHSNEADAKTELLQQLSLQGDFPEDYKMIRIEPSKVTRHSDGTFQATGETYGDYAAFTMEGRLNNLAPGQLVQAVYEWNGSEVFPAFKLVGDAPYEDGDILYTNGNPPVVLDPAYANAPWAQY